MSTRPSASRVSWQMAVSLVYASFIVATALAAPPVKGKAPSPSAKPDSTEPARPVEIADAHPSSRPATPDLQLGRDAERKAEAMALYAKALLLEDAAETELALAHFRKAFDLDPANSDLAIKLAYQLAQKNDPSGGIEVLKDTIKAAPKDALPLVVLAQLYAKYLKKPETGIRYAEQALTLDPDLFPAYLALFDLFSATNQTARAEQLLQRAQKSTSTEPGFWLQIGGLCQQAHLREDGTASSREALKQMNDIFARAAALGPNDALVQAKVGNFYIESKQTDSAIPHYLTALSLKQTSDDPVLMNAGDKLARALLETGQQQKAIGVLEKIANENPLRFETYELLGELYLKQKDLDRAVANFKHSILLDASEPRNHIRVAEMQIKLERYAEAIETAQSARARFPDDPRTLYLYATALSAAKKHTDALAVYAEALADFETSHEEYLDAQFYFNYGATAEQAGIYDKAEEMLRRSIALDPSTTLAGQAANYLGYMWVDRGENLEEAGDLIRKAIGMEPENAAYLDSLGWFYFKKGDYEKALKELLHAAELIKAEDAVVLEHVGDTYQQLGRPAQALQYWQKSLALDAENKKVAAKIDSVKQKVSSNNAAKPDAP